MKKLIILWMTFVVVMSLAGCNRPDKTQDDKADMQFVADMVEKSKDYADSLFHEQLSNESESDYEIAQINYGFITDDPLIFIIGYEYTIDHSEYLYGYKLRLNEDLTFTVIEEGESIGEFIMR